MCQAPGQDLAEEHVEAALIQWLRFFVFADFRLNQIIAKERCHHDRYNPRQDQRCRDDGEQVFTEFRGGPVGKGDGNKPGAGNERARQHGLGRRFEGIAGRIDAVHSLFQLDGHHFNSNNGIIDEKTQGDDE